MLKENAQLYIFRPGGPTPPRPVLLGGAMFGESLSSLCGIQSIVSATRDEISVKVNNQIFHIYEPYIDGLLHGGLGDYLKVQSGEVVATAASKSCLWLVNRDNTVHRCILRSTESARTRQLQFGFEHTHKILEVLGSTWQSFCLLIVEDLGLVLSQPPTYDEPGNEPVPVSWVKLQNIDLDNIDGVKLCDSYVAYLDNSGHMYVLDLSGGTLQELSQRQPKRIREELPAAYQDSTFKSLAVARCGSFGLVTVSGEALGYHMYSPSGGGTPRNLSGSFRAKSLSFGVGGVYSFTEDDQMYYMNEKGSTWCNLSVEPYQQEHLKVFQVAHMVGTENVCLIGTGISEGPQSSVSTGQITDSTASENSEKRRYFR